MAVLEQTDKNMIENILQELVDVWTWILSLVAGLGLAVSLLIIVLIFLFLKVAKISSKIRNLENRVLSMDREISLQINKIKSSKDGK